MTEEEKKAIKNIKEMIENIFQCEDDEEFVCDVSDGGYLQTALNLIQKQDTEINKLNNVIDRMARRIKYDTEWFYSELDNKSEEEIKEYFMKE